MHQHQHHHHHHQQHQHQHEWHMDIDIDIYIQGDVSSYAVICYMQTIFLRIEGGGGRMEGGEQKKHKRNPTIGGGEGGVYS